MNKPINRRTGRLTALLLIPVLILALSFSTAAANDSTLSAVSVVVLETQGDVEITNQSGNTIPVFANMQLHSGYTVKTDLKSYAWMSLDDTKEAGLDSVSNMAVQKQGKQLVLMLDQGNMFFDVSEKLESDETMNIRTSTMVMGIKGTFGYVKSVSNMETVIGLLDGSTEIIGVNTVSGKTMRADLSAGQEAIVRLYDDGGLDIIISSLQENSIPGFVLTYLSQHEDSLQRIEANDTGLDPETLVQQAEKRLAEDETEKEEKLKEADAAHEAEVKEAEESDDIIDPYFKTGSADSTGCTHSWIHKIADTENHIITCSLCGKTITEAHSFGGYASAGADGHTGCCSVCGYTTTLSHNYYYQSQGDGTHIKVCSDCGCSDGAAEACSYTTGYNDTCHYDICPACGYTTNELMHDASAYVNTGDAACHTAYCDCGYSWQVAHEFDVRGNCHCGYSSAGIGIGG